MILYELAIEMGERSSEVAERARTLGLTDAGPATDLSADQEAAIRAGVAVPPSAGDAGGTGTSIDTQPAPMSWQADPTAPAFAAQQLSAHGSPESSSMVAPPMARTGVGSPVPSPTGARPTTAAPSPSASPTTRSSAGGRSLGGFLVPVSAIVVGVAAVLLTWQFFQSAQDNSEQVQQAVQPVTISDGSDNAAVEQCRSLDLSDPIAARLGHVCSSLTPTGTPLAAAASAALTAGGLEAYTTPDPGRFCLAADQAISLVDGGKGAAWEARRSIILADRANLGAALTTIVAMSPPRWVSSLDSYAMSMQGQLDGLGPDSGADSWKVDDVSAADGATSPLEDLRTAFALSCG